MMKMNKMAYFSYLKKYFYWLLLTLYFPVDQTSSKSTSKASLTSKASFMVGQLPEVVFRCVFY